MKIEMNEAQLQQMLFWQEVYQAEIQRVVNVLNHWSESWKQSSIGKQ